VDDVTNGVRTSGMTDNQLATNRREVPSERFVSEESALRNVARNSVVDSGIVSGSEKTTRGMTSLERNTRDRTSPDLIRNEAFTRARSRYTHFIVTIQRFCGRRDQWFAHLAKYR
jgi:hypothetical protein